MTLILLEALGAGLLLVFIVWWTAFSGRPSNPPANAPEPEHKRPADAAPPLELEKSTSTDAALSGTSPSAPSLGTDAQADAPTPPTPKPR